MNFNVTFTKEELPDLRKLLDRAMNTWDPRDQPGWLQGLSERVDRALAGPPATPSRFGSTDLQALILDNIRAQQHAALKGLLADPYLSDPINNDRMAPARIAVALGDAGHLI